MLTRDSVSSSAFNRVEVPPSRPDTFELRQLVATLRRHYWFVIGVALSVFAAVMLLTLLSRMQFRSVSRLYLGELDEPASRSAATAREEIDISSTGQGVVGSEIEIIQSRSLVARAVADSGLNVSIRGVAEKAPRYGQWLLARRNQAVLDPALRVLRAREARLSDAGALERLYRVRFATADEYEVRTEDGQSARGKLDEPDTWPGAQLTLRRGEDGAPKPGEEYWVLIRPTMVVIDEALAALTVTAPRPTPQAPPLNVVTLEFVSSSPTLSASFLDRLVAAYLDERQKWKVENATAAEDFVSAQLATIEKTLDEIQEKLAEYRTHNRVVVMDNEAKAMIEQIGKYEEQRVAAHLEVTALNEVQRTLKTPNPPVGAFLLGEAKDSVLEEMAKTLSAARQNLTDLENRYNEGAPELREQRHQVEAQLEAIRNYVASRSSRAKESLGALDRVIGGFEARLRSVPGAELGMIQLSREQEVYGRTYQYLLERQQQLAIIKASTLSKNRVLDPAQAAYREDSPKLVLRLLSAPLGVLLGVAVVLLRSLLAGSFQSEADARAFVDDLPVFASVPQRAKRRSDRHGAPFGTEDSSFAEAFRILRANLSRAAGSAARVLLVTSPSAGDGKTTCARALAAALAADGKRVVLVEADLRKPCDTHLPGPRDAAMPGLSDVLGHGRNWVDALRPIRGAFGLFYAMEAGNPAAPELLSSPRLAEMLGEIRPQCDFVLLDVAAFPGAGDALVLAKHADLVLSVLRLGHTARQLALEHLRDLTTSARAFAVILNCVGTSKPASAVVTASTDPNKPIALATQKRSSSASANPSPSSPWAS